MEHELIAKSLRCCADYSENFTCSNCGYYGNGCRRKMLPGAATAIEELMAQVKDKDYLIQQQTEEIQRMRADVKKQQENMIELAKKLPKRGEWIHGREIGKEWIYDHWVAYYEDWHCSNCKVVFEQEEKPNYNYCPNCGAKMEVQE